MRNLLFICLLFLFSGALRAQDRLASASSENHQEAIAADTTGQLPIRIKTGTLFYLKKGQGAYPAYIRATQINERLAAIEADYNELLDTFYLETKDNFIQISNQKRFVMAVTEQDAEAEGTTLEQLAQTRLQELRDGFAEEVSLTPAEWAKNIGFFLVSLIGLYLLTRVINLLFARLNKRLSKIERRFLNIKGNLLKYFLPSKSKNIFMVIANVIRLVVIGLMLFLMAPFLFSFFPLTKYLSLKFYDYIKGPLVYIFDGIVDFIPSLFFIVIICLVSRYFARVIRAITNDVDRGNLTIKNFHKDWAKPTGKLAITFLYALTLVLIFPYLPGSGSTAFQGVSIFIGAIISFGSTSAIANIIAGVVITYMRPFQIGDRVKIDNIVGDVVSKTMLVTNLITTKKESVTIPNANILIGNIINYSSRETGSIILHTTVTLGYDLPWQEANDLLLKAAQRTPHLYKDPEPFVLQTSLDDFYVSYELNAHTDQFKKIPLIYSELHKNILDVFDEAGVEILSPGYMAARDGGITTVPSQISPKDRGPLAKVVDHFTGRNQPVIVNKPKPE